MFWIVSLLAQAALLAIVYLWSTRSFPALFRRRRAVAIGLVVLAVTQIASRWTVVLWHVGSLLHTVLIVTSMALGIAAIPIALLRVAGWLADRAARRRAVATPSAAPSGGMTRRQVVEATGGVAFLGATGSMLGWGMVRGRHAFETVEVPVRIAALPRALDGYVIAQVSDLHTGIYVGERDLDEGFERVRAARPDLVVVTGDLVDFDPAYAPLVARKLADLAPRDGVVAILGNHDYYAGAEDVLSALRSAGVAALVDEGRVVRASDGGGFALLGVDDLWSTRYGRNGPRLDHALATVAEGLPRILLSHQPHTVDRWRGQVALQLSGHTHGGQINPGFRPADLFMRYVAGSYRVGSTVLYVNSGFGTVGPPSRVGAPPEITRVVLVAA
jgi:predicted MPP superfamily phosphohydrolase